MMMRCRHYALFLPRPPIVRASRFWLALLSLLALLAPAVAGAQCVLDGTTVTCDGSDPDGFDAGGTDGLTVDVLPDATVDNGGAAGVNALNLGNDNGVMVQAGVEGESAAAEITASGAGSHGISAGTGNTVTNRGSIEVSGASGIGISAGTGNTVSSGGNIEVSGAGGIGISVGDGSAAHNHGTITTTSADSVALSAGSNRSDAQNVQGAEIVLQGNNSIGIRVGDDDSNAVNWGTITADTDGTTGIIGVQIGNANQRFVQNLGTITITGANGIGMDVGDANKVENAGTLVVSGASGIGIGLGDDNIVTAAGIIAADGSDGIGISLGDRNTVTTSGNISASGSNGIGVLLGTTAETGNRLNNFGTITGGSGSGAAVSFADSGSGSENLLRNRLGGGIDGSASGVAIRGSAGVDTIWNEWTITGDVQLEGGDDAFELGTWGVIAGAVDGGDDSDTLRLRGSGIGAQDLSIFNDFELLDIVEGGTWTLRGSGSFPQGATVTNGTLALPLDETLNLSGDYTQRTGTSLLVHLNPDGSNDQLAVDGNATIETGTILRLEATAPLVDEAIYTFLTTTGTLTGLFDDVSLLGDSGLMRFSQLATANSLAIEFSLGYTGDAATANQMATAIHLEEIVAAGPTGDMETVLQSLSPLPDSELQAALDALHPETYDAQASAALSFGRTVTELAASRRPRCEEVVYERRPEIVAPSPCSRGWTIWGSPFGLFAKREGDSGHIDFSHGGGGLLLGADYSLSEHFLAYGFLGGGYTSVDVDGAGDGSLFNATLGAGVRWSLGGSQIHGLLGYARGWHKQEREIVFADIARTAKADYSSDLIMALVKAGHTFRFGSLDVEPLATVEYGYLMEDSFRESGADDLDLDVDKRSNSVLSTTVGARLAYSLFKWEYLGDFLEWADGVWTPELTARWRNNWIGTERDLDARLVGAPAGVGGFTVEGQGAEQGFHVGGGVAFRPLRLLMSIRLGYDGFYGDGSTTHRIGATIRIPLGGSAS